MTSDDPSTLIAQLTSRVRSLEDIAAIQRLKIRYATEADNLFRTPGPEIVARLLELFTDDAILDLGPFGRYIGRSKMEHAMIHILPVTTVWSTHYIVNPDIDVRGDTAQGRFYVLIQMQSRSPEDAPPAPAVLVHAQYEDHLVRTKNGWKFSEVRAILHPPR